MPSPPSDMQKSTSAESSPSVPHSRTIDKRAYAIETKEPLYQLRSSFSEDAKDFISVVYIKVRQFDCMHSIWGYSKTWRKGVKRLTTKIRIENRILWEFSFRNLFLHQHLQTSFLQPTIATQSALLSLRESL